MKLTKITIDKNGFVMMPEDLRYQFDCLEFEPNEKLIVEFSQRRQDKEQIDLKCLTDFYISNAPSHTEIEIMGFDINGANIESIKFVKKDSKFGLKIFSCFDLNEMYDSFWETRQLINTMSKILNRKHISNSVDFGDMEGYCDLELEYFIEGPAESLYKIIIEAANKLNEIREEASEKLFKKFIVKNFAKITIPTFLHSPLKQYLSFFEDFIWHSKGEKISLKIFTQDDVLVIRLDSKNSLKEEELQKYFFEFISFVGKNITEMSIDYKVNVTEELKSNLLIALVQQIEFLKNSINTSAKLNGKYISKPEHIIELLDVQNSETKKVLISLVCDNHLEEAITKLENSNKISSNSLREIHLLKGSFNRINSDFRKGLTAYETKNTELVKISDALLDIINIEFYKE